MKDKIDIETAKQIPIIGFLMTKGIIPQRENNKQAWYLSPFRNEKEASFEVRINQNRWHDFGGEDRKGDIIDLVQLIEKTDFRGAVEILLKQYSLIQPVFFSGLTLSKTDADPKIKIVKVLPITHKALVEYIHYRRLKVHEISLYCNEIWYTTGGREYFAIGFKNDEPGGYELRNKKFKGKNIDAISTFEIAGSTQIYIFEGFINFLSYLQYYMLKQPTNTTIVLNSLKNLQALINSGKLKEYKIINLFFDNDPKTQSGQRAAIQVGEKYPNTVNHAKILYPEYNDFNDFIRGIRIP